MDEQSGELEEEE